MFVGIKNVWMMINADVNVNWLTKEYVIRNLFGILVIVNLNVINNVILEIIYIIKTVNAGKNELIN